MPQELTRRAFVGVSAGALSATLLDLKPAHAAAPAWQWYSATTLAVHEQMVPNLISKGYRPLSISMMGAAKAARVNLIWVQRQGVLWDVGVDVNLADLDLIVNTFGLFGYTVTQLGATGDIGDPRFGIIVEQKGDPWQQ